MPLLDISDEPAVQVDGVALPLSLLRALLVSTEGYVHVETDEGAVEGVDIRRDQGAVHFTRSGRSGKATEARPAQTHFRAEVRGPGGAKEWVQRGSARHLELVESGWTENGVTRPGNVASSAPPSP